MKNRNENFPIFFYFTWKLEFVSNILWVIVDKCNGTCDNALNDKMQNVCVLSKKKNANVAENVNEKTIKLAKKIIVGNVLLY